MRKIEPEFITGMGYIGASPGVLYRMGGAGEQTVVTGNPALLEGVKGSRITSLTLHGKSTQGSTTGAQLFDFENAMQKIIGNWTSTNILSAKDTNDISVKWKHLEGTAQTYIAIVCPFKFDANKTIYLTKKIGSRFLIYDENGGSREVLTIQSYTPTESFNGYIGIGIDKGTKVDGSLIFSYAPNFLTSEPYTGGAPSPSPEYPQEIESAGQSGEISVKVGRTEMDKNPQVVIIPTPGGLPGIPVSSGGNYTDKDGQQWVCDEIDLARGERVEWIGNKVLQESDLQKDASDSIYVKLRNIKTASNANPICSHLKYVYYQTADKEPILCISRVLDDIRLYLNSADFQVYKDFVNNNEVFIIWALKTPIRTPLPPETIAAYKALHTYSPTTTVINDAGAGMSVGYVADTKLYIDKKIDGVMKALANTQAHLL